MRNIKGLLAAAAAAFGIKAMDFSEGCDLKFHNSQNKPNRVSQKKRRLNQRRRGN